jgi:hypothetical protein
MAADAIILGLAVELLAFEIAFSFDQVVLINQNIRTKVSCFRDKFQG